MKDNENENDNVSVNDIIEGEVVSESTALATLQDVSLEGMTREEIMQVEREALAIEAEIEAMALPSFNSRDLIGQQFDILDAAKRVIMEEVTIGGITQKVPKDCILFTLRSSDDYDKVFTCLKGFNPFNSPYVDLFNKTRGTPIYKPVLGYEFVTDPRYNKAGNDAIVLRKVSKVKVASKK